MKYKLKWHSCPDARSCDSMVFIVDENGNELNVGFATKEDAFDYIKIHLEKDPVYTEYIKNSREHIADLYNELDDFDKRSVRNDLIEKYQKKCIYQYFK